MAPKSKKLNKIYNISESRVLSANKDPDSGLVIFIQDLVSSKKVEIPAKRWVALTRHIDNIDRAVKEMVENKYVKLETHIGGLWYVSVTTGFRCVDLRKFFIPYGTCEPKPTRDGIALRLPEWQMFKEIVKQLHVDKPELNDIVPCFEQLDHQNLDGAMSCPECGEVLTAAVSASTMS